MQTKHIQLSHNCLAYPKGITILFNPPSPPDKNDLLPGNILRTATKKTFDDPSKTGTFQILNGRFNAKIVYIAAPPTELELILKDRIRISI